MSFKLSIITPLGEFYNQPVESVLAPGACGQFMVLSGHEPILYALKPGVIKVVRDAQTETFTVGEAILEVDSTHQCLILAQSVS